MPPLLPKFIGWCQTDRIRLEWLHEMDDSQKQAHPDDHRDTPRDRARRHPDATVVEDSE